MITSILLFVTCLSVQAYSWPVQGGQTFGQENLVKQGNFPFLPQTTLGHSQPQNLFMNQPITFSPPAIPPFNIEATSTEVQLRRRRPNRFGQSQFSRPSRWRPFRPPRYQPNPFAFLAALLSRPILPVTPEVPSLDIPEEVPKDTVPIDLNISGELDIPEDLTTDVIPTPEELDNPEDLGIEIVPTLPEELDIPEDLTADIVQSLSEELDIPENLDTETAPALPEKSENPEEEVTDKDIPESEDTVPEDLDIPEEEVTDRLAEDMVPEDLDIPEEDGANVIPPVAKAPSPPEASPDSKQANPDSSEIPELVESDAMASALSSAVASASALAG